MKEGINVKRGGGRFWALDVKSSVFLCMLIVLVLMNWCWWQWGWRQQQWWWCCCWWTTGTPPPSPPAAVAQQGPGAAMGPHWKPPAHFLLKFLGTILVFYSSIAALSCVIWIDPAHLRGSLSPWSVVLESSCSSWSSFLPNFLPLSPPLPSPPLPLSPFPLPIQTPEIISLWGQVQTFKIPVLAALLVDSWAVTLWKYQTVELNIKPTPHLFCPK